MYNFKFLYFKEDICYSQEYGKIFDIAFTDDPGIKMYIPEKSTFDGFLMMMIGYNNMVAGCANFSRLYSDPTTAIIHSFFIQKGMQGRGYSKIMMEELLKNKIPKKLMKIEPSYINKVRIDSDVWNKHMTKVILDNGFKEFYHSNNTKGKDPKMETVGYIMDYDEKDKINPIISPENDSYNLDWNKCSRVKIIKLPPKRTYNTYDILLSIGILASSCAIYGYRLTFNVLSASVAFNIFMLCLPN